MKKIGLKGGISDEDFMIHVLNNLLEKYDVILERLENCLTSSGDDALTKEVIRQKINHGCQNKNLKMKGKKKKKMPWSILETI